MRILILNQTFHPDVVSTAQHASDLAAGLAERGHDVTVICSRRAYDNPKIGFAARETWRGVTIVRIPLLGLGKGSKLRRALVFASFLASCAARLAAMPRFDVVIAMTSPPLISYLGALFVRLKGGRLIFWVMDLNPDEAIAAGWLPERSLVAALLQGALNYSLRGAERLIVLDRFMKERIVGKGYPEDCIDVVPPWSHDNALSYDCDGRDAFRARHGLEGKHVVMYSGNHSPCHPLDTLLEAALRLRNNPGIAFCFIGGGSEFRKVREFAAAHKLRSITCLPYQALDQLSSSLSAADMQAVVLGEPFVGIVHPCKVYNVLALGIPVLYVGPSPSHITDMLPEGAEYEWAYVARHGDAGTVVKHILAAAERPRSAGAVRAVARRFSQAALLPRIFHIIESTQGLVPVHEEAPITGADADGLVNHASGGST